MKEKLFSNFGCEVYLENGGKFVYFDSGESAGSIMLKAEINDYQYEKIMQSERDAYKVILSLEPFCKPA